MGTFTAGNYPIPLSQIEVLFSFPRYYQYFNLPNISTKSFTTGNFPVPPYGRYFDRLNISKGSFTASNCSNVTSGLRRMYDCTIR